jgi:hypothetical protein
VNTLRAYKFLVVPVLQSVDEDGTVVGEAQPEQPDTVYGVDALVRYAEGFEHAVEMQNAALANGGRPAPAPIPEKAS